MDKLFALLGAFLGFRLGRSPSGFLLVLVGLSELAALVLVFSGSGMAAVLAIATGAALLLLGVRCGGGIWRCALCSFFQFFFLLGALASAGDSLQVVYFLAHMLCVAYPIAKAFV